MFSIVISAPNPFYLYVRDESDEWQITIKEINEGNYDALKLHRVSFFLDVGLEYGTPMGFAFDGSMLVPRNPSLKSADDAIDCFNRVKAALLLGGLQLDQTTSSELAFGDLSDLGYFRYTDPHGSTALLNRAFGELGAGSLLSIVLDKPRRITKSEVEGAFKSGSLVFSNLSRVNAAFLVTAFSCAAKHEHRSALIFGWVALEQVVEHLWTDCFLSKKDYFLSENRKQSLKKLRNVSQKIEMLRQSEILSDKAYTSLHVARKARNKFAHNGGQVSREDAVECLKALLIAIDIYSEQRGIPSVGLAPLSVFQGKSKEKQTDENTAVEAGAIDWSDVKYWREIFKIPGDENWAGDEEKLDGILLKDVSAEIKATNHSKKMGGV